MLKIWSVRPARFAQVDISHYATNTKQLTFQCKDLLARMHNCTVGSNRSPQDIVGIGKVDNDDLVLFIDLFSHAYEMV